MLTLPFQVSILSILTCSIKYKWESSHSRYMHSLARVSFSDHLSSVWFSVPYPMGGDNRDVAKIQRQRLHNHTQPISTKLCKRHSEVKGIQVCSFVFFFKRIRTVLFSRGSYISDIYQNTFTTLKSANFNQTSHTSFLCEWDEWLFKGKCQREIIGELQKCIDNIQNSFSTETLGKYQQVESILG